jgi:type IV pilus assembly protein PilO
MTLTLNKLPWYAQVGLFVVVAIAGVGAFWNYYARPTADSIEQREAQLAVVRTDITRGLATARRLPEFRRQVTTLEAQLDRLRPVLPDEKDVADLLRRLQAMATQSALTIRGFAPQAVATKQMYAEWPIGLQIDGTYNDLGSFLERVSKFPRIINVTGIHIRTKAAAGLSSATISADCTATTFVLLEPKAATTAAAVPAAAPRTE